MEFCAYRVPPAKIAQIGAVYTDFARNAAVLWDSSARQAMS